MHWREEQKLTEKHGLRKCSMGRCCNAQVVDELKKELEMAYELKLYSRRKLEKENKIMKEALSKIFDHDDIERADAFRFITIAQEALDKL